MFYLDRRGDATTATIAAAKYDSPPSNGEENFGWWLNHWKLTVSPGSRHDRDHRSSGSSASMLFCIDSDDSNGCIYAQEPLDGRQGETCEKIELRTFTQDDLDIELIESDAGESDSWPTTVTDDEYDARNESKASKTARCSPGKLIRCQEYRIPAPSSRCSSRVRHAPMIGGCRARLSCSLIDSERIDGTQPRTTLKPPCTRTRMYATSSPVIANSRHTDNGFATETRPSENLTADQERREQSTETVSSSRSSYDKLNSIWDDCHEPDAHLYSLEDTSGIQSNDCSSDKQSDTPMSLCDELAIASKDLVDDYANNRGTAINEVASILESLQNDPEKATVLLEEEDRFCDCRSSHNQLVRLALAIETDAEEVPAIPDDPNNWVRQLRDKIERLQHGHKEIRGDIRGLHGDFQHDESRISDVSDDTAKLRGQIRELRCLDDLLTLIQGELAKMSRRSWPFVLGNSEPREQVNLIV
ncbi:uncharacterized protein LOC116845833 [Odontomachus brunneus]|uniref:uncharacterized protein LOC116845833 n=1 Tax=Odontomachus brunneus TaxID=486640 RepID=UPI0013F21602|nr:uncharacterized protein LOC116845833 [Odontomachus brunneus]XP_032674865.1 uncharacterized protein LOC116845833 [Odontomachus brunneus]XP_032674867.1 uncharacterized protein LOC116845833 [Odontomachus brunneus]XP_032674868.1 uncharacterized protein LOC116845833 [Odontomachus brunneus]XP_032674869.1 uncharacterized protein LOC116845833 [Odontomachus brunneus]XP_032674870.1 uncharacterized protein LOC116845833 [Odontomachus brunneus]XP_032674871.1 uncharacterized protein LOC116845833 [Odonto